jgi:23S rRNA pseudouridine1911/1915/1917 synthase
VKRTVTAEEAGQRLDVWLARQCSGLSRSRLQALIREGQVTAGGRPARPSTRVACGLEVEWRLPPPAPAGPAPEDIPLGVLHEDADVIVVNKPAGLVVHPAAGHASGTLVNALLHRCRDLAGIGGAVRPGIVHRLDKDTSGAMVVAKTDRAMASLVAQFKAGRVEKEYRAIVAGAPPRAQGTIETLIGRCARDRKKMSAHPAHGRRAVTRYKVLERFAAHALLGVRIETGRTHQIRVHMAHLGCPVLGDRQYGTRGARREAGWPARQMLHAYRLAFDHPATGERTQFEAPLPDDMQAALDALRRGPSTIRA